MSEVEAFYIPRQLDEPERLLFWSFDEAAFMIFPMGIGIMTGHILMGMILGALSFYLWKRVKGTGQVNLAIYGVYWYLPSFISSMRFTPPSYKRFYLG